MPDATHAAERPRIWSVTSAYRNRFNLLIMTVDGAREPVTYFVPALRRAGWVTIDTIGDATVTFEPPVTLEFNARSGCLERVVLG